MVLTSVAAVMACAVYAAEFPLKVWESADAEGVISDLQGNNFLYTVTSDYKNAGSKYTQPIGWVRVRSILNGKIGFNVEKLNQFECELAVSADSPLKTPISISVASFTGKKDAVYLPQEFESGKTYQIIVPFKALRRLDAAALKRVESVQFVFREAALPDGKPVKFRFSGLRLTSGDAEAIKVQVK